jgi:CheY-like chemotaxis protein
MAMARVLVSEADPDVRRLLGVLVERLGHEAIVLDPSAEVPPRADLLLLDAAAPFARRQLRLARLFFPDLPVICMGAFRDGDDDVRPAAVLEKPFAAEALEDAIGSLVASPV